MHPTCHSGTIPQWAVGAPSRCPNVCCPLAVSDRLGLRHPLGGEGCTGSVGSRVHASHAIGLFWSCTVAGAFLPASGILLGGGVATLVPQMMSLPIRGCCQVAGDSCALSGPCGPCRGACVVSPLPSPAECPEGTNQRLVLWWSSGLGSQLEGPPQQYNWAWDQGRQLSLAIHLSWVKCCVSCQRLKAKPASLLQPWLQQRPLREECQSLTWLAGWLCLTGSGHPGSLRRVSLFGSWARQYCPV